MTEPLIRSQHVVGGWDPDTSSWSARDHTPGPAGSAFVDLPGGIELDVDVAAPLTLTGLLVPGDGATANLDLVVALLGERRAAELVAQQEGPSGLRILQRPASDEEDGSTDELSGRRRGRGSAPRRNRLGVDARLGRLALAVDLTDDPDRSSLVRALALIDAAGASHELSTLGDVATTAPTLAEEGLELLRGELDVLGDVPLLSDELGAAIRQLLPLFEGPARVEAERLLQVIEAHPSTPEVRLAVDIASSLPTAPDLAAPSAASARSRAAGPVLDIVDLASLPAVFARAAVVARPTTSSEIELRIPDRADEADGWWVRAHSTAGVLLAATPLRAIGSDAVARLLVPPAQLRSVVLDVTDQPGIPREPMGLQRTTDAIQIGRSAARAERLGDRIAAQQRWSAAAAAHSAADDPARAGQAAEYSRGDLGDGRVPAPLLADAAIEAELA